jgi:AcrR family transcriptional regulator
VTATPRWETPERPEAVGTSGRPLSARGLRTRAKLVAAAEEVFGEHGWHDASIVKITEAAGVSQGTFYLYFASKQEIFVELVRDLNRRVRQAMSEGAAAGTTRAEKERGGFVGFFRFTAEHPALYRVIRQAEFAAPDVLHEHYERIAEGYVAGLRDAMDAGEVADADPEVVAYALMAVGEMVGMRWILWGGHDEVPDEVLDEVFAFISRGLGIDGEERA